MLPFIEEIAFFLSELPFKFRQKSAIINTNTHFYCPEKHFLIVCIELFPTVECKSVAIKESIANDNALRTICISEDVWRTKTEIVKSRIRAIFGISQRIPARLTKVQRIDKPTLDRFLNDNHLQGTVTAKLKYGLFLPPQYFRIFNAHFLLNQVDDRPLLVAVASFSNSKTIIRNGEAFRSYELIRFANLLNCTVVGGLNKLLKNFIREQNPDDIMSYADRDWSDGNSYQQTGFELIEATSPQTFLVNPITFKRLSASKITPEIDISQFVEVKNSGNLKYLLNLKKNTINQ
jgi:hypothetical protein